MQRDFYKAEAEILVHPHVSNEVGQPPLSKMPLLSSATFLLFITAAIPSSLTFARHVYFLGREFRCSARLNNRPNAQETEQLVASVMRYMLFRQQQKPDQLVRRDELSKLIQSNNKDGGKRAGNLGTYVISQAQAKFPVIFGLEMKMVEVSGTRAAGKAKGELCLATISIQQLPAAALHDECFTRRSRRYRWGFMHTCVHGRVCNIERVSSA